MKVTLEISDIDYGAFVKLLLPKLKNKLANSEGAMPKLLSKIAGMSPDAAAKVVNVLPQKTKNDFAVYLINNKRDILVSTVMELAEKKGLSFKIDELSAE